MLDRSLTLVNRVFDAVDDWWETETVRRASGTALVLLFVVSLLVIEAGRRGWLPPVLDDIVATNHFAAISLTFTALLIVEVVALILALARSVATSVGIQFELFSLILLREAFKELGKLPEPITWATAQEPVFHALADAGGALVVFVGVIVYGQLQRHRRITTSETEQYRFVTAKKAIALGLLVAFVVAGLDDAWRVITQDDPYPFFDAFFTALIFADVLVVLVSLRYTDTYAVVFRNAGFALATVILRLALVAPAYVNVALGVGATAFVIGLTAAYNRAPLGGRHATG
ncbi:hypothetical protein [Rubrivirga sp.]|uniref:hypothetical protein n=1 Tax=Rubrivirga sp. TaxID=1885344 RepID=UPI003C77ACF9